MVREQASLPEASGTRRAGPSAIDIGVVIAGPLDTIDRHATEIAIDKMRAFLAEKLPEFQFRIQHVQRPELTGRGRIEPSVLLQQAAEDRDARHWDFVFVVTAADLIGNYMPFCFAVLSRPLDAAVFSLSLIDPQASNAEADRDQRTERIAGRLFRLWLNALGHLTGLARSSDPHNLMYHPATSQEIDQLQELQATQIAWQHKSLLEIADQRLEESSTSKAIYPVFAMRAGWINRREIMEAVWGARPWEFPRRLSRLTLASVSTVFLLLLTAESWDLALSQSPVGISCLSILSLLLTTLYVIQRQQLLVRRGHRRSEQIVVTSTSALAIVFLGMAVTWLGLLMIGFCCGWLLFRPELIVSWASASQLREQQVGVATCLQMGCFAASVGLVIGALGASFESQNYFRHVIFVDEEL